MTGAVTYLGGLVATCWLVSQHEPMWGVAVLGVSLIVSVTFAQMQRDAASVDVARTMAQRAVELAAGK